MTKEARLVMLGLILDGDLEALARERGSLRNCARGLRRPLHLLHENENTEDVE